MKVTTRRDDCAHCHDETMRLDYASERLCPHIISRHDETHVETTRRDDCDQAFTNAASPQRLFIHYRNSSLSLHGFRYLFLHGFLPLIQFYRSFTRSFLLFECNFHLVRLDQNSRHNWHQ